MNREMERERERKTERQRTTANERTEVTVSSGRRGASILCYVR